MTKMTATSETGSMPVEIGISSEHREMVAEELAKLLADTYTLYLKTHNFHWNVTGPMFQTLHLLFETHYNELWTAVDEIAERIRTLGFAAPGSYREFSELTSIDEADGVPEATEMVRQMVAGHEAVIRTARHALPKAGKAGDATTEDLLATRLSVHEKTAWMLRSLLS